MEFKKCLEEILELNKVDEIYLSISSDLANFDHVKLNDLTVGELMAFDDRNYDMQIAGSNVILTQLHKPDVLGFVGDDKVYTVYGDNTAVCKDEELNVFILNNEVFYIDNVVLFEGTLRNVDEIKEKYKDQWVYTYRIPNSDLTEVTVFELDTDGLPKTREVSLGRLRKHK